MYLEQRITIIIPALNESAGIGLVIAEIPDIVDDIIVVDNGSTDDTAQIAKARGARVVVEKKKGYGAACLAGLAAISHTDLVAFVDGDYSDYPKELEKVIEVVASRKADLAIGCRHLVDQNNAGRDRKGGLLWHQRHGNWLACGFIRLIYGYRFTDFGPMRCIRWEALDALGMSDMNYGWTAEMQIKAARKGFDLVEIPVRYRPRLGSSKISGTLKGSVLAGYKILYWSVRLLFLSRKKTLG